MTFRAVEESRCTNLRRNDVDREWAETLRNGIDLRVNGLEKEASPPGRRFSVVTYISLC